ncbi:MAG: hypothetical protein DHS20C11_11500 [Lysobacteraceae bacterium]|nr:MAG: hypothetical protein DHS20C11_11500 [Xanthomonadaceae bacterium]
MVSVGAFAIAPPASKSTPAVASLSERGQAALIEALANPSTNPKLLEQLQLKSAVNTTTVVDMSQIQRRVIVSVETDFFQAHEADRITALKCTLENLSNQAQFVSWDKFESVYETVDLGKLTLTQGSSITVTPTETAKAGSGDVLDIGGSLGATRNLVEELAVKKKRVVMSGRLTPTEAIVSQQGALGIDLVGNFAIDLTLDVPHVTREVTNWSSLKDSAGAWNDQDRLKLHLSYLKIPSDQTPVTSDLRCDYLLRKVTDGQRYVVEGKQEIEYVKGSANETGVTIIGDEKLIVRRWFLETDDDASFLYVKQENDYIPVYFSSYPAAVAFRSWLYAKGRPQGTNILAADLSLLLVADDGTHTPLDQSGLDKLVIRLDQS